MPASTHPLTPPPSPRPRGGTFEGLEKLFFDKAAAIEAGELTAPPEVVGSPLSPWWVWQARPLHQKLGAGAAAAFLLVAALVMFGPGKGPAVVKAQAAEPTAALSPLEGPPAAAEVPAQASPRTAQPARAAAAETRANRQRKVTVPAASEVRPSSDGHARARGKAAAAKNKRHRSSKRRLRPVDPFN